MLVGGVEVGRAKASGDVAKGVEHWRWPFCTTITSPGVGAIPEMTHSWVPEERVEEEDVAREPAAQSSLQFMVAPAAALTMSAGAAE
jgi:hypothetical protein